MKYFNRHFLEQLAQGRLSDKEKEEFRLWLKKAHHKTQQKWLDTFEKVQTENVNIDNIPDLQSPTFQNQKNDFRKWWVAAALILVFLTAGVLYFNLEPSQQIQYFSGAEQSKVFLSDSTEVNINQNGRISVLYTKELRQIELEGEASFKVTRNENRPLVVKTEEINTTVLGTEFNIKQSNKGIQISLKEGSVKITQDGYTQKLEPNEKWFWDRKTNNYLLLSFESADFKEVRFENEPLPDVLDFLEWQYDIDLQYDMRQYENCSISITINEMALKEVLDVISFVNKISFNPINENQYVLSGRCN
ncbi:FecR family protein [Marivirga sp.]|uniref:FecR family protein n=1 Tax=Marivirga sp. TaxID=2018662 RepID=UPI003DA786A5